MSRRRNSWFVAAALVAAIGATAFLLARSSLRSPTPPRTGPVVARIEATPDSTRIGQPVEIVFEVRTPAGTEVAFAPRPADDSLWTWQRWQLADAVPSAAGVHHRLEATALPFRAGELLVPTPAYRVTREGEKPLAGRFPALSIRVASVLPEAEPAPDIRGLKPPLTRPWWMRVPWWLLGLVLVVAAAGIWLWRRWRRRTPAPLPETAPAEPVIPAHTEALAALDELAAAGLPEKGLWYEHQSRLSAILRRYLERRFGSPRESLTTRELCLHLRWRGLPSEEIERLRNLLRVADLAKFARTDPGRKNSLALAEEARALVLLWAQEAPSGSEATRSTEGAVTGAGT